MFCVECGNEDPIFRDGVCLRCYLKTHTFTKGPRFINIPLCVHCNSFKYKNTWASDSFDDFLIKMIKNNFEISKELENVNINTECKDTMDGKSCKVLISGCLDNAEIIERHTVQVRLKRSVCDVCSRRQGGYYEATVQVRADKRNLSKKELSNIIETVESFVNELQDKGNRGLFIADIGEEHGGLDFYISESGTGYNIAKKIQEKYGGEIKKSTKDAGTKDSRQVYRMTYLVRIPSYQKNDFIQFKKSYFIVSSIHSNKIRLIDLGSWNELKLDFKDLQKATVLGGKELVKEMIFISQSNEEVQIMDSEKYEIKYIRKPKPISFKSEKIKTISIEDRMFLCPENL